MPSDESDSRSHFRNFLTCGEIADLVLSLTYQKYTCSEWAWLYTVVSTRYSDTRYSDSPIVPRIVRASSQSNGNGQISTPRGSKTDFCETWNIYYVGGMTTHANPHGATTTWAVSANTWLVTYLFRFLSSPFVHPKNFKRLCMGPKYPLFSIKYSLQLVADYFAIAAKVIQQGVHTEKNRQKFIL